MRRYFIGAGLALAGLALGGATNSQAAQRVNTVNEVKATVEHKRQKQNININYTGGLDFEPSMFYHPAKSNWMPKLGHVNRKTNKQRCKHNAKLKRR